MRIKFKTKAVYFLRKIKKYQPNLSSRVYTSDGLLLEKFFVQERIFVPINRIPKNYEDF